MSVVVMAYRNAGTVVDAVRSVVEQVGTEQVEVIVVDSGGDGTASVVHARFPGVVVVESPHRLLPGGARNAGVAMGSGEVIAFLAADCIAEPGWVAERLAAHRAGRRAVASAVTYAGANRVSGWASHYILFSGRLPGRCAGPASWPDPAAHSLSFSREVLDLIGPFDESLRLGEDTEAARRLKSLGVEIWFEPRVRTAHRAPLTGRDMLRDAYRRGALKSRFLRTLGERREITVGKTMRAFLSTLVRRTRWTLRTGWHYGRGERWRVALSVPWIVVGRVAGLLGFSVEEVRAARRALRHRSQFNISS